MKTVPQNAHIHETLRHLFYADGDFDIRQANAVPALLPGGDALWIDQDAERVEEAEAIGDNFYVIRIFDLKTGAQLNNGTRMGLDWWTQQMGDFDYVQFGYKFPNTYLVNESYLFVSGGAWMVIEQPDPDGMGRFVSTASINAAEGRQIAEWFADHAEAVAMAQPTWADSSETWVDPNEGDIVEFGRTVGTVKIEQSFTVRGGDLEPDPKFPATVRVVTGATDYGVVSVEDVLQVGMDLLRAGQILHGPGNVSVSIFEIVAKELGVSAGDVYMLGNKR